MPQGSSCDISTLDLKAWPAFLHASDCIRSASIRLLTKLLWCLLLRTVRFVVFARVNGKDAIAASSRVVWAVYGRQASVANLEERPERVPSSSRGTRRAEILSRPVDQDLLGCFGLGFLAGSLDELAVDKGRSGAD
jgi:hypothetical protein